MTTSEAIKEFRYRLNMSQQAFATALGISMRAVANYEAGRSPQPRQMSRLERFAAAQRANDLRTVFKEALAKQLE